MDNETLQRRVIHKKTIEILQIIMSNKESMDDDYVSLSFETNKHETFVNARNAGLVQYRYSGSREKAARHSQFARAWRRSLPFPARGKYSCSVHGARGVRGGRGADTEVDKQGKR